MEDCRGHCKCSTEIENLQQLLKSVNTEKELAIDMYKVSAQTIETLEEELENHEGGKQFELLKRRVKEVQCQMQNDYSEAINILEEKLRSMDSEVRKKSDENRKKSDEIAELNAQLNAYQDLIIDYDLVCGRETELKEKCLILETKCLELEKKLELVRPTHDEMERQIEVLTDRWRSSERQTLELQSALERATEVAKELTAREVTARQKVVEAVTLVEFTLVDKQTSDHQQLLLENECRRLKKELIDLIDEAGNQVAKETEIIKQKYESQMQAITSQMEFLEMDRDKKSSQVENLQKQITSLETQLEELKQKSVSVRKCRILTQQIEENEAKIRLLDKENQWFRESQLQSQESHERELSSANARIRDLQHHIDEISGGFNQTLEQCNRLETYNEQLLSQREVDEMNRKKIVDEMKTWQSDNMFLREELRKCMDKHDHIIQKWREEYKILTSKFENKLKENKNLLRTEKKQKKRLSKKLEGLRRRLEMFSDWDSESIAEGGDHEPGFQEVNKNGS